MAPHYKRSLKRQLDFIIAKHPHYRWGGAERLERGLDCSGYLFLAAKWSAIPGITRTTALRMSLGLGGWTGKDLPPDDADECDLVFWTIKETRPNGHVGAVLRKQGAARKVTHSSLKRGVVLEDLKGPLLPNLSKVRRLTIGD